MFARFVRKVPSSAVLLVLLLVAPVAAQPPGPPAPPLPMARQIAVREGWLARRYEMLLRTMRAHKVGMWIVVNEEFHDDPLASIVAAAAALRRPARHLRLHRRRRGRPRSLGHHGLLRGEHPAVLRLAGRAGAAGEGAGRARGEVHAGDDRAVDRRRPRRHAQPHVRRLQAFVAALGPEAAKRIVPAEPLIEEFLEHPDPRGDAALRAARRVDRAPGPPGAVERGRSRRASPRWATCGAGSTPSRRGRLRAVVPARPARAARAAHGGHVARVPRGRPRSDGASSPATSSTSTSA